MKILRTLLACLLLAGLGGFVLAQGTLIIAQGTDAVTLDPHNVTDGPTANITEHIFETLFAFQPDGTIGPRLVESYEVSPDGLVWTLNLRQGVTFHDGTPFDAQAVKRNLDRFLDPDEAFQFRFSLTHL